MFLDQRYNINKIRMIRVDIPQLYFYQIFYHLLSFTQRFREQSLHNLKYFEIQILESFYLCNSYRMDQSSQLLVDELCALY